MQCKFKLILSDQLFCVFSNRILKLYFEEGRFSFLTGSKFKHYSIYAFIITTLLYFWWGPPPKNLPEADLILFNTYFYIF